MPRITEDAKIARRQRIVDSACHLFKLNGFDRTTTRDIARYAGIAAGTLFNYFPSKEDIVMALIADSIEQAEADFTQKRRAMGSFEEDLFLNVAAGLRRLKPHRQYVGRVIETSLSPLVSSVAHQPAQMARATHLETVQQVINEHGLAPNDWAVAIQLYWTLYLGVLAFWVNDSSPKQEDTLAMLDQSINMFSTWLRAYCPQ